MSIKVKDNPDIHETFSGDAIGDGNRIYLRLWIPGISEERSPLRMTFTGQDAKALYEYLKEAGA